VFNALTWNAENPVQVSASHLM